MGLEERRKIKELEETTLPGRVREIEEICGKAIPYEVDWTTFAEDAEALKFLDNISCHRLNMALRSICIDDMGKEAIRDGLRLVRLSNTATPADMHMTFQDGVLDMRCAYALRTEGMYGDMAIRDLLLKGL